jgi:hypothetical protein
MLVSISMTESGYFLAILINLQCLSHLYAASYNFKMGIKLFQPKKSLDNIRTITQVTDTYEH